MSENKTAPTCPWAPGSQTPLHDPCLACGETMPMDGFTSPHGCLLVLAEKAERDARLKPTPADVARAFPDRKDREIMRLRARERHLLDVIRHYNPDDALLDEEKINAR